MWLRGGARHPARQTRRTAWPAPAPPLTEEALHDSKRVAEPILPTGHLADGPGPTRPGVPRRGSSLGAWQLLDRAFPHRANLAEPAASAQGTAAVVAAAAEDLQKTDRLRVRAPSLHFAQWREIGAADRAACDLGGARAGGAAGARCAAPRAGRRRGPIFPRGGPGGAELRRGARRRHLGDWQKDGHARLREAVALGTGRRRLRGACCCLTPYASAQG